MSDETPRDPFATAEGEIDPLEDFELLLIALVEASLAPSFGPLAQAIRALDEPAAKRIVLALVMGRSRREEHGTRPAPPNASRRAFCRSECSRRCVRKVGASVGLSTDRTHPGEHSAAQNALRDAFGGAGSGAPPSRRAGRDRGMELGVGTVSAVARTRLDPVEGGDVTGRPAMVNRSVASVPRFALTREEAAASLGMSLDSFERHVQSELKLIRRGKLRLVPVVELERWAERSAESVL